MVLERFLSNNYTNGLILKHLKEHGFDHSAYTFRTEGAIPSETFNEIQNGTDDLLELIYKGKLYENSEKLAYSIIGSIDDFSRDNCNLNNLSISNLLDKLDEFDEPQKNKPQSKSCEIKYAAMKTHHIPFNMTDSSKYILKSEDDTYHCLQILSCHILNKNNFLVFYNNGIVIRRFYKNSQNKWKFHILVDCKKNLTNNMVACKEQNSKCFSNEESNTNSEKSCEKSENFPEICCVTFVERIKVKIICVGTTNGLILFYHLISKNKAEFKCLYKMEQNTPLWMIRVSPDNNFILCTNMNNFIEVVDLVSMATVGKLSTNENMIWDLDWDKPDSFCVVTDEGYTESFIIDYTVLDRFQISKTETHYQINACGLLIKYSKNKELIAVAYSENFVQILSRDLSHTKVVFSYNKSNKYIVNKYGESVQRDGIFYMEWISLNKTTEVLLVVSMSNYFNLHIMDTSDLTSIKFNSLNIPLDCDSYCITAVYVLELNTVFIGTENGKVYSYNIAMNKLECIYQIYVFSIYEMFWNPYNSSLMLVYNENHIVILDFEI